MCVREIFRGGGGEVEGGGREGGNYNNMSV